MKQLLLFGCLLAVSFSLRAQSPSFTDYAYLERSGQERKVIPNEARYYEVDASALRDYLHAAPAQTEFTERVDPDYLLVLPDPDGGTARFRIVRYEMMEKELSLDYPEIVNLLGVDIDQPTRRIRLDWTYKGFHASVTGGESGRWFVEPLLVGETDLYQVYYTNDYPFEESLDHGCKLVERLAADAPKATGATGPLKVGDCVFREYRLAMATTGEYHSFHGGTNALVLSEVNTVVSRVNEVTELDLAIRMTLVANTDLLFYSDASTDPYTNNNGSAMLGQNQTTVDNIIGTANYDMGHVFSTGDGGVAVFGSICSTANKARGVTGRSAPTGDPFYIDLVAHEMGHQFGGDHTFNSDYDVPMVSFCGTRVGAQAYEPGSGSTIQAYAGICDISDVQNNSDPYYHAASIVQISTYMESGAGNSCDTPVAGVSNSAPTVNAGANYTIPKSTPFKLTATGNDPNGDALTYCWEQYDLGDPLTTEPTGGEANGPIIRSLSPSSSPSRYIDGTIAWEALPSVDRTLNFRVTARDINTNFGCTVQSDMLVTVADVGPFAVTAPNGGESAIANSAYTVTWDVGGTGSGTTIDCANVMIELSLDGGNTYSTLIASTSNDGSESVMMPDVAETDARIRISCTNNIFYDFSDLDFSIVREDYAITVTTATATICEGTTSNNDLEFQLTSLLNYSGNISFSETNLPAGTSISYSSGDPAALNSGNSPLDVTITLSNTGSLTAGTYDFMVTADDGITMRTVDLTLNVESGPTAVTLLEPADNAVLGSSANNTFSWTAVPNANEYRLVYVGGGFIRTRITSTTSTTINAGTLDPNETYTWTVEAINTNCGTGTTSVTHTFTTTASSLSNTDSPLAFCEGVTDASFELGFVDGPVTGPANLSIQSEDVPAPGTVSLSASSVVSGSTFEVNVDNLTGVAPGTYTITVLATGTSGTETIDLVLEIEADAVPNVYPADGDQVMITNGNGIVFFEWGPVSGATNYILAINGFIPSDEGTSTQAGINFGPVSDGTMITFHIEAETPGGTLSSCDKTFTFVTALPVEWLDFEAKADRQHSVLHWRVLQDGQGKDYTIERQLEGEIRFEDIDQVVDNGLEGETSYNYTDKNVVMGQTYYYRLRQRDMDGAINYSPIREVSFARAGDPLEDISLVPNPATDRTSLLVGETVPATHYQLYDSFGRLVRKQALTGLQTTLDLSQLPAGVYHLVLVGPTYRSIRKLVKN